MDFRSSSISISLVNVRMILVLSSVNCSRVSSGPSTSSTGRATQVMVSESNSKPSPHTHSPSLESSNVSEQLVQTERYVHSSHPVGQQFSPGIQKTRIS